MNLTDQELQAMASMASPEMLSGKYDVSLDFNGGMCLTDTSVEKVGLRSVITNNTSKDLRIVLFPGSLPYDATLTLINKVEHDDNKEGKPNIVNIVNIINELMSLYASAGVIADSIMIDGIIYLTNLFESDESLLCTAVSNTTGVPIWSFVEFCRRNPTRIPEIIIASNNDKTYNGTISIIPVNPLSTEKAEDIALFPYFDQRNNKSNFITVPTHNFGKGGLQLDDQVAVVLTIPAAEGNKATIVDLSFKTGATANQAKELQKKAIIAQASGLSSRNEALKQLL